MSGFFALLTRELRLAARTGGEVLVLLVFFVMIGVVVPFSVGPDKALLARLSPGVVWMAAFLAMLLGLDRLFRADAEDGTLAVLMHARAPLAALVGAKVIAHWLLTALPLIVMTPVLALMLNMDFPAWQMTVLSLLVGTPGLTALGALGASVTVSLRRGGLLAPVIILPMASPILIFGAGATSGGTGTAGGALLLLAALSLVLCALSPFAAALALRASED